MFRRAVGYLKYPFVFLPECMYVRGCTKDADVSTRFYFFGAVCNRKICLGVTCDFEVRVFFKMRLKTLSSECHRLHLLHEFKRKRAKLRSIQCLLHIIGFFDFSNEGNSKKKQVFIKRITSES